MPKTVIKGDISHCHCAIVDIVNDTHRPLSKVLAEVECPDLNDSDRIRLVSRLQRYYKDKGR